MTLDLDSGNPLVFKPADDPGLAVIRLRSKTEPADLERALRVLAAGLEAGPIADKLWIVEPSCLREYQPEN